MSAAARSHTDADRRVLEGSMSWWEYEAMQPGSALATRAQANRERTRLLRRHARAGRPRLPQRADRLPRPALDALRRRL
jgi:hypothetical protein